MIFTRFHTCSHSIEFFFFEKYNQLASKRAKSLQFALYAWTIEIFKIKGFLPCFTGKFQ